MGRWPTISWSFATSGQCTPTDTLWPRKASRKFRPAFTMALAIRITPITLQEATFHIAGPPTTQDGAPRSWPAALAVPSRPRPAAPAATAQWRQARGLEVAVYAPAWADAP